MGEIPRKDLAAKKYSSEVVVDGRSFRLVSSGANRVDIFDGSGFVRTLELGDDGNWSMWDGDAGSWQTLGTSDLATAVRNVVTRYDEDRAASLWKFRL